MYNYKLTRHFTKQAKRYIKKFPKLFKEILKVLREFDKRRAISLGSNVFKVKLSLPDMQRGKSRSFRLIILIIETKKSLVPAAFYSKSDRQNITKQEIILHKKIIEKELGL